MLVSMLGLREAACSVDAVIVFGIAAHAKIRPQVRRDMIATKS
jgi:hypothetical protein